jgi:hypothetical protein
MWYHIFLYFTEQNASSNFYALQPSIHILFASAVSLGLTAIVFLSPIYVLPVCLRFGYLKKPLLCHKKKTIVSFIVFLVWMYFVSSIFPLWCKYSVTKWLLDFATPFLYGCIILFLLVIVLLNTCLVSFIILGYSNTKPHRFYMTKPLAYFAASAVLYTIFLAFCVFFIGEGGFIYFYPCSEIYTTTKDFPRDKLKNLKSLLRLTAVVNPSLAKTLFSGRVVSYEDFLTVAAASPALLPRNSPKFYFHYWTNEILYPLSDDLAQKEYWGRKWITSRQQVENHYLDAGWMREAFLASKYISVLKWAAEKKIEEAYQEWLRDKEYVEFCHIAKFKMTPEEDREWLYWYKEKLRKR